MVTFDPWTVMDAAFVMQPTQVLVGEEAELQGFLVDDSNGDPLPGTMADNIFMGFDGGPLGTVDPAMAPTMGGVATTTWTAGDVAGVDFATVSLDAESFDLLVEVLPAIIIDVPVMDARGLGLLSLLMLTFGIAVLRRRA